MIRLILLRAAWLSLVLGACTPSRPDSGGAARSDTAGSVEQQRAGAAAASAADDSRLPPSAESAAPRLAASTRHGEWAMIPAGSSDSVRAWIVYPERSTRAPVVVVIHEIFGLTTWVRAVADQLAAGGFIAIAPDLLTGQRLPMPPDRLGTAPGGIDSARAIISSLDYDQVIRRIEAAGRYGTSLPAALPKWGVIGFCWGGSMVFATAANVEDVDAAVAYYGGANRDQIDLSRARAPTLALYGENDARVNMTIPYVDSSYRAAGTPFERRVLRGAGHGFLRDQSAHSGANLAATRAAWPETVEWLRRYLGE